MPVMGEKRDRSKFLHKAGNLKVSRKFCPAAGKTEGGFNPLETYRLEVLMKEDAPDLYHAGPGLLIYTLHEVAFATKTKNWLWASQDKL